MLSSFSTTRSSLVLLATAAAITPLVTGCGSSSSSSSTTGSSTESSTPAPVSLKISEKGGKATYDVPESVAGGLVAVSLNNQGKAPHGVEFIQYTGSHTESDALKILGGQSNKIPSWIKLQGGIGSVPGGQTGSADLNLPAGNYVLADAAAFSGPSGGPP